MKFQVAHIALISLTVNAASWFSRRGPVSGQREPLVTLVADLSDVPAVEAVPVVNEVMMAQVCGSSHSRSQIL